MSKIMGGFASGQASPKLDYVGEPRGDLRWLGALVVMLTAAGVATGIGWVVLALLA